MQRDANPHACLIDLFKSALAAVRADRLAEAALAGRGLTHVIALGKAGEALAAGAWRALGQSIAAGFLATPRGYAPGELLAAAPFERREGAHPVPDESSLAAGAALLHFVDALPADARVAVLISGGASASVEALAAGVDLAFLRRANRWLLASGLPIGAVNRVRAGLSDIKGGGLALRLVDFEAQAWVMADTDDPAWVGGGLIGPSPMSTLPAIPTWLSERLRPIPAASALPREKLAANEDAVAAVIAQGARSSGRLTGDASEAGVGIARFLLNAESGLYVWGGETTVHLPERPGRGGRCQQLALAAASLIVGRDDCCILAASTDGWDGTDPVAGACVDGGTVARGEAHGFDAESSLRSADAGSFLAASGDLIRTGPTGTHVNDLIIAKKT
jgi:hydroxypyruvate reductase